MQWGKGKMGETAEVLCPWLCLLIRVLIRCHRNGCHFFLKRNNKLRKFFPTIKRQQTIDLLGWSVKKRNKIKYMHLLVLFSSVKTSPQVGHKGWSSKEINHVHTQAITERNRDSMLSIGSSTNEWLSLRIFFL